MPLFRTSDRRYRNVNAFANQQGLEFDDYGKFAGILAEERRDTQTSVEIPGLHDHALRFKVRRSRPVRPVLYVAHAYISDGSDIADRVAVYAAELGLEVRFNHPGDQLRVGENFVPVVFWRCDLHEIEAPLRLS